MSCEWRYIEGRWNDKSEYVNGFYRKGGGYVEGYYMSGCGHPCKINRKHLNLRDWIYCPYCSEPIKENES
jgi:hypothetical protein